MKKHEFSVGFIEKVNDFIMKITFTTDVKITLENIKEITVIRKNLFGDNPYCSLIDARKDFVSFSKEAQVFTSQNPEINKLRVVEAIVVKNFGQKLGAEMYIRIFKPKKNTKVFDKEEQAVKWLTKMFEKHKILS